MELYHSKDAILTIDSTALKEMLLCVLEEDKLESGGILLGRKKNNCETYSISKVGLPSELDKRSPFSFVRSSAIARKIVNNAWKQSLGIVNHIGEWHSHIFDSSHPSYQDQKDMMRAYQEGECLFEHFFTVIISRNLQIYTGLVFHGEIIDSNIIRVGKEYARILYQ